MPELPEVQTTVNGLNSKVLNRTFVGVWTDWKKMVKKPASFEVFRRMLRGKKILRVWRRGKNVIFELSGGYSLLIHMKMTGHLMVGNWVLEKKTWVPAKPGPFGEKINGFIHFVLMLDNKKMIALSDMRKFAKVELWQTQEMLESAEFKSFGPEPLEKSFTFEKFKHALDSKQGKVKEIIMRPQIIAGVGNIYASEALWWAKIHPAKNVAKLSGKELKALYNSIRKVLQAGIDFGGDSFSDYRDVDGLPGKFEGYKRAYQNKGNPCARCKTPIAKMVIAQRGTFFCPNCQKL